MSTLKFEATPLPAHAQTNPEAPRKKRKRAPAQGAADDCFTCSSRNIKCDRRRPYCSQCLDGGQDCAGYKTQLTWGVGVASRGKLRGLSLPIAGTTKTPSDAPKTSAKATKRINGSNQKLSDSTPSPRSAATSTSTPSTIRSNGGAAFSISVTQAPTSNNSSRLESHTLRPLTTRVAAHTLPHGVPTSSPSSLHVYNAASALHHLSPITTSFPLNRSLTPLYEKSPHMQISPYPTPSPTNHYFHLYSPQHQLPPTPTSHASYHYSEPTVLSQPVYHQPPQLPYHGHQDYISPIGYVPTSSTSELAMSNLIPGEFGEDVEEIKREFVQDGGLSDALSVISSTLPIENGLSFPLSGVSVAGKTPRMQYLIQYYAEVISPVIVAFDSPSNPLRNQILGLAAKSESLQHAISALSASNIRQRQESGTLSTGKFPGARRSSYMHQNLISDTWDDSQSLTSQDRKREESLHKYAAVRSLNQQLANPHLRNDDSVLATLLMLCLFHICDSGIARFQTQFAGVKKLLSLRGTNFDGAFGNTKWMTRIFAFFDSMAATVNDREGQIGNQYVEISAQSDGDWPYETLSGVDSRLVRPLSRLGRLNVLGLGKPAESHAAIVSRPLPTMLFPSSKVEHDASTFDGNGWMRIVSDEDLFNLKTAEASVREQFWREWREVRQDLQTWTFDSTRFNGSDPSRPVLTPDQCFDMCNISESFRFSALLYTERLADPKVPSTDPKIQDWVQKSLYHIKQVRSDVYLLWPLFITGAECGHEHERNIIRERCLDIQRDSGFMNNSSCLALLEKVWQGGSSKDQTVNEKWVQQPVQQSPFKFRDVMLAEGNEGEWIVV